MSNFTVSHKGQVSGSAHTSRSQQRAPQVTPPRPAPPTLPRPLPSPLRPGLASARDLDPASQDREGDRPRLRALLARRGVAR